MNIVPYSKQEMRRKVVLVFHKIGKEYHEGKVKSNSRGNNFYQ